MARNSIIVSNDPRGRVIEGWLKTGFTPKPGTIMELTNDAPVNGWNYFKPFSGSTGTRTTLYVLLENDLLGRAPTEAYLDSEAIKMYVPLPGDEVQVLIKNLEGTADDHPVGEKLIVDTVTGKLVVTTGSPESEPFELLEAVTDPTADVLALARCTGF